MRLQTYTRIWGYNFVVLQRGGCSRQPEEVYIWEIPTNANIAVMITHRGIFPTTKLCMDTKRWGTNCRKVAVTAGNCSRPCSILTSRLHARHPRPHWEFPGRDVKHQLMLHVFHWCSLASNLDSIKAEEAMQWRITITTRNFLNSASALFSSWSIASSDSPSNYSVLLNSLCNWITSSGFPLSSWSISLRLES